MSCGQTNIPEVDNSTQKCVEYVDAACVILGEFLPIIGVSQNDTVLQALENLANLVKAQGVQIELLKQRVEDLENV